MKPLHKSLPNRLAFCEAREATTNCLAEALWLSLISPPLPKPDFAATFPDPLKPTDHKQLCKIETKTPKASDRQCQNNSLKGFTFVGKLLTKRPYERTTKSEDRHFLEDSLNLHIL